MRWITLLIVVVVLAAAGWFAATQFQSGISVEAAQVRRSPIREFVDDQGKTRLPQTWLVTMPYAGRISAIELTEGSRVEQGQVLAEIVPLDRELTLELAQAALDRAEAAIRENDDISVEKTSLAQTNKFVESMEHTVLAAEARVESGLAKRNYAEKYKSRLRDTASSAPGSVTRDEIDRADLQQVQSDVDYQQDALVHASLLAMKAATDLSPTAVQQYIDRKSLTGEVLEKERDQAQFRLKEARRDHNRGQMLSPVDGVVLTRHISDERHLSAGTTLLEIGRLDDLEIEVDVLSQDVVRVQLGDEADVYGPAIGPEPARGKVTRVYPAGFTKVSSLGVEQQRVKVVVTIDSAILNRLRQERNLGVGYRVNVKIFTDARDDALVVPRSALFRGAAGDWKVFAIQGGVARLTNVKVGLLNDEWAEITSGLTESDTVILAPETQLTDGTRVAPSMRQGEP